jgi:hypothetical protein
MLSLFPDLLFLGIFATTMVRIAAGLAFCYAAYRILITKRAIADTRLPLIGHTPEWMIMLSALITLGTGILLFVGMWTQGAAIVGMLIALKHGLGARRYEAIVPLSLGTYALLFVICLSLLVSGAGAFAVDLPL